MPDHNHEHDEALYQKAHQAQIKAIQARQRKNRRRAHTQKHGAHTACGILHAAAHAAGTSPTHHKGLNGEQAAATYLVSQGLTVLERNLYCKIGEIDLVARDGNVLVFIEVRLRNSTRYGGAAASINHGKQRRIVGAARYFLPALTTVWFNGKLPHCRFDVISINGAHMLWIPDAFQDDAAY